MSSFMQSLHGYAVEVYDWANKMSIVKLVVDLSVKDCTCPSNMIDAAYPTYS